MYVVVTVHGLPVRSLIAEGTVADCAKASEFISEISVDYVLADRAYDTDLFLQYVDEKGIRSVIPSKRNRKVKREHDKYLYKLRHLAENAILHLKCWRGIATRYAKHPSSFLAAVYIRCRVLWTC